MKKAFLPVLLLAALAGVLLWTRAPEVGRGVAPAAVPVTSTEVLAPELAPPGEVPGELLGELLDEVPATPSKATQRRVAIRTPAAPVPGPVPGLMLGGRLTQAFPSPVKIQLTPASWPSPGERVYHWGGIREVVLGADGVFLFTGLEPGFYIVRAASKGHGHRNFEFELTQSITDAHLVLERGLTLAGVIERAYPTEAWESLSIYIELEGALGTYWNQHIDSKSGAFRFENLIAATYKLSLSGWIHDSPRRRIKRVLSVRLAHDIEDFRYTMEDDVIVWLEVELPTGAARARGVVTASSGAEERTTPVWVSGSGGGMQHGQLSGISGWHGEWEVWSEHRALKLAVPRGNWNLGCEIKGYKPWSESLRLGSGRIGEQFMRAVLEPLEGQLVEADLESVFYRVEQRASGSSDAWDLLLWNDERSIGTPKGTQQAWLAAGTFDLRITSLERVERQLLGVELRTALHPFVVNCRLESGVGIEGSVVDSNGEPRNTLLDLERLEPGGWTRQDIKRSWGGTQFQFHGLVPGTYRALLLGEPRVVATWELGDEDLLDQIIVVGE